MTRLVGKMKLGLSMKTANNSANVYLKAFGYVFIIVYILWSSKEIARLSNSVDILRKSSKEITIGEYRSSKNGFDDQRNVKLVHERYSVNVLRSRTRRSTKEECKVEKQHLKTCRNKLKKKNKTDNKQAHLEAGQVEIDFKVNSTMKRRLQISKDSCFQEYGGTLCYSSKTFENGGIKNMLGVPWKLSYPSEKSPLEMTSTNGQFKVKYDGVYLIYLNILLIPSQHEERFGVFLDDLQIMTCQDGLLTAQEFDVNNKVYNLTEKSCSTLGVFYVNKNQILSIRIETKHTKIRLWSVGNNFGVVLLHSR